MAITQKYSTNAAVQYNETLDDYLIADNSTGKKFLTEAPLNRLIRANELSALYFLIDDASFTGSTILKFKDEAGNLIGEEITNLTSTYNIHNGVLIGFENVPYYVPANTKKICAVISSAVNLFSNADFALGTGNLFTDWTLAQPSRTNLITRSNEFDQWTTSEATITPNAFMGGDKLIASTNNAVHLITRAVSNTAATWTYSILAMAAEYDRLVLYVAGSFYVGFNLTTGVVESSLGTGITSASILPDPDMDGRYLCSITSTTTSTGTAVAVVVYNSTYLNGNSNPTFTGDGTSGIYIWDSQLETGPFATPRILTGATTVTTSLGEFSEDPTGGVDGGRALMIWADASATTLLSQSVPLVIGQNYTIRFRAKANTAYGTDRINIVVGATDIGDTSITDEWAWYSDTFTASATATTGIFFSYLNEETYGFASFDKVSISLTSQTAVTEERCFILDERCFANENQIQWVNKLGGVDTWTFTGNPIEAVQVDRESLIEYPMQNNYQAPNEIYAYRSIKSFETMTLFHRCENEETAVWLRSELLNSIAMYLKVAGDFHPIIPIGSTIETKNFAQRNTNVRFNFRFAYDINIQKR